MLISSLALFVPVYMLIIHDFNYAVINGDNLLSPQISHTRRTLPPWFITVAIVGGLCKSERAVASIYGVTTKIWLPVSATSS